MRNYFKLTRGRERLRPGDFVFFDDHTPATVLDAYEEALRRRNGNEAVTIVAFCIPEGRGDDIPWRHVRSVMPCPPGEHLLHDNAMLCARCHTGWSHPAEARVATNGPRRPTASAFSAGLAELKATNGARAQNGRAS